MPTILGILMKQIRDKALLLLTRRDHSRRELYQKLFLRGFPSSAINVVLDELENSSLLSEERFIACYIRSRAAKGFGPLKICAELANHGIDDRRVQSNEEWQTMLWQESANWARIKRFGEAIPLEKPKRLQQARFLQQRGFASEQIQKALSFTG